MAEWNESQKELIEKLEKTEGAFDNILNPLNSFSENILKALY